MKVIDKLFVAPDKSIRELKEWIISLWIAMLVISFMVLILIMNINSYFHEKRYDYLGILKISKYSELETKNKKTAFGYEVNERLNHRLVAISRDIWNVQLKEGDILYIPELQKEAVFVGDLMGAYNRNGVEQKRWIDLYEYNYHEKKDRFGIKNFAVYRVRKEFK